MPVELPWKNENWPDLPYPTKAEFEAGRKRRYGTSNPEVVKDPFLEFMVRTRSEPFFLRERYGFSPRGPTTKAPEKDETAIWSFLRIGTTTTLYRDRYRIHIGGEHDDAYDPDFLIYNDVIVEDDKSNVWIYTYPRSAFQPTDFHTATLLESDFGRDLPHTLDDSILIVGGICYASDREFWRTPVYQLDLGEMWIRELEMSGDEPGWIYGHQAFLRKDGMLQVMGGKVMNEQGAFLDNEKTYALNLWDRKWTCLG